MHTYQLNPSLPCYNILMYYILQSGRAPLHVAVLKENNKEVVGTLIKAGDDVYIVL